MLDKDKLRKADIFSGAAVFLFGLWVLNQALKMPMKDSWGGVMNVWFVSPALMPLFVGAMIMLLGALLCRMGFKAVGFEEFKATLRWLVSADLKRVLASDTSVRFYAIALLFLTLVYINLPRIDFFLCAVLFLAAFITMFFFLDDRLLRAFLRFYLAGEAVLLVFFALGLHRPSAETPSVVPDLLALAFIFLYAGYVWLRVRAHAGLQQKFRVGLVVSVATPFVIGPVFKYFLMVPLPKEGLVVAALDYVWYLEFL